jgi:hypothetical protein
MEEIRRKNWMKIYCAFHRTKTIKYQIVANNADTMSFCTSCGKEVAPGKKFCEYCGTPVEQPAAVPGAPATIPVVPAAPVSIQQPPEKPSGGSGKIKVIAGIIVVVILIAGVYFVGLPIVRGTQGTGSTHQQAAAIPTRDLTPPPALITTETINTPGIAGVSSVSQTYEKKYTETYNLVYSASHAFSGGQKEVFTQDVTNPPLYIKFNITPTMYYGERPVDIGLSSEHVVNLSYVSPDAWFKVTVYDAANGGIVDEQGFNKEHSTTEQQEFMVRAPGNYRVEMTGNEVTADIQILTGKSG